MEVVVFWLPALLLRHWDGVKGHISFRHWIWLKCLADDQDSVYIHVCIPWISMQAGINSMVKDSALVQETDTSNHSSSRSVIFLNSFENLFCPLLLLNIDKVYMILWEEWGICEIFGQSLIVKKIEKKCFDNLWTFWQIVHNWEMW